MKDNNQLKELDVELDNAMDSLQNVRYAIQRIIDANAFKVGDVVVFKDSALASNKNDGLPLLEDVQFIIHRITHKKNKSKETTVNLVFGEFKAHYYKINNQECKLSDKGVYKIENVPFSAIKKEDNKWAK